MGDARRRRKIKRHMFHTLASKSIFISESFCITNLFEPRLSRNGYWQNENFLKGKKLISNTSFNQEASIVLNRRMDFSLFTGFNSRFVNL